MAYDGKQIPTKKDEKRWKKAMGEGKPGAKFSIHAVQSILDFLEEQ
jgi:hypothetical protein